MTHLENLLSKIKDKHVYIQTHNFPDADAIGSAFGLQYLLKQSGIASTICYGGKIDRSCISNVLEALNIELVNTKNITASSNAQTILIDTQPGNSNLANIQGNASICIDHHPVFEENEYDYVDIRPENGACASIIASYFLESGYEMPKNVATAILYGIKIDTLNLTRGVSELDLDMFYNIFKMVDLELVRSFDMSILQLSDLASYAYAINSIHSHGDISFTSTGIECPEALIANISDFMLSLAEISLSVVYSIKREGIKLSVRSDSQRYDAGIIINQALKGIGNGGGHAAMAGGFVEFDDNPVLSFKELIDKIEQRIIEVVEKLS